MAQRKVYHVVPHKEGGWDVRAEGAKRAAAHTGTKQDAVDRAKELAKSQQPSQVKIHGQDNKIQTEHTYKDDPNPPKG
jgi:uncharacterized protein YdaT